MKKILILLALLVIPVVVFATVDEQTKTATLINPITGEKKVVLVGDRSAFSGGFILLTNKQEEKIGGVNFTELKTVLNAVSATTTSDAIDIEGAKRVSLSFTVSNLSASGLATSTFTFLASIDGTNYVTYNKMIDNLTNSNSQTLTRVANQAIDSNTTDYLSMDLEYDIFKYLKVVDTITGTTTSSVTVKALVDYE